MSPLFSGNLELANLLVSSDLLDLSLAKTLELHNEVSSGGRRSLPSSPLRWKKYQLSNYVLIAFVSPPLCSEELLQEGDLVSSAALRERFPDFDFPFNRGNSSFSVHSSAIDLFERFQNDLSQLHVQISDLLNDSKSRQVVVITGYSLGGSVASLFTLWLLDILDVPAKNHPLCITFGSPLVGDNGLQESILEHTSWNSCFVHVAAREDPIPRFFFQPHCSGTMELHSQATTYKPFGTFLLCSELGCTSLDDPAAISEVMVAIESEYANEQVPNDEFLMVDYRRILEKINLRIKLKGTIQIHGGTAQPLEEGIVLQLEALGIEKAKNQKPNDGYHHLIKELVKLQVACISRKKKVFNPSKKLVEQKKKMAYLEWYKKDSKRGKLKEVGYYDCYRHHLSYSNKKVTEHMKYLENYWKEMVAEALKKPQEEGGAFRTRWLYGGNNYRRMVEPLDIAEYYKDGGKNYITEGRSQHYTQLEKWLEEAKKPAESSIKTKKKKNVENTLTDDSCFWAHVEEALISCKILNNAEASAAEKESSRAKLIEFEGYVMEQIKNYAVSSEIFLAGCSFMKWWRDYEKILGARHNSQLVEFMKNHDYHKYATGAW